MNEILPFGAAVLATGAAGAAWPQPASSITSPIATAKTLRIISPSTSTIFLCIRATGRFLTVALAPTKSPQATFRPEGALYQQKQHNYRHGHHHRASHKQRPVASVHLLEQAQTKRQRVELLGLEV